MKQARGVLLAIVGSVALYPAVLRFRPAITAEDAIDFAGEEFRKTMSQLCVDGSVFSGPLPLLKSTSPYAFVWQADDQARPIKVHVFVDTDGSTEVAIDGDLQPMQRKNCGTKW
jgi:hypothetical protein